MPRMIRCGEIEAELVATAAGEAEPAAERRVHEHAAACRACRDSLAGYRAVERAVAPLRAAPVPEAAVSASRERLEARLADLRSRLVAYDVFPSPFGELLIARSELGVLLVEYLDRGMTLRASRLRRSPGLDVARDGGAIESLGREVSEYLAGRVTRLNWPLDLRLARTPFRRAVLEATAAIPYGAVVSYTRVAREIGRPEAVRAVAQALRWNPLPIVIPCHRVIGASGALVGYAGGAPVRKRRLLEIEGVPVVRRHHDLEVAREAMYLALPGETEYCLPCCPAPGVVRAGAPTLFTSRARAEAAGLVPCSACRPDLHPLASARA